MSSDNDNMKKDKGAPRAGAFGPGSGHGPGGMMMGGQKAKNFKGTMRNLLAYMRPYRLTIIAVFRYWGMPPPGSSRA
jgi:ATP-binding cassette subfamily B multidrug efflux pump